jgi:hypothetical protein
MWEILYSMTSSGSKNKKFVITEIMSTKHTVKVILLYILLVTGVFQEMNFLSYSTIK